MIKVTLIVKEGEGSTRAIRDRLNKWFTEGAHEPPYPPGTLLSYSIHGDAEVQEDNDYDAGLAERKAKRRQRAAHRRDFWQEVHEDV